MMLDHIENLHKGNKRLNARTRPNQATYLINPNSGRYSSNSTTAANQGPNQERQQDQECAAHKGKTQEERPEAHEISRLMHEDLFLIISLNLCFCLIFGTIIL